LSYERDDTPALLWEIENVVVEEADVNRTDGRRTATQKERHVVSEAEALLLECGSEKRQGTSGQD
jgi:hypothetical protein